VSSILIVDDYAAVRSAIRVGLERYSEFFVCGEADSGVEAIEKATRLNPDLILLDLVMPGMNGMETACILKRLTPHVHIVAFSMYSEWLGQSPLSANGIDAVVDKFAGVGKVVECLRTLPALASKT
jgi:DNA-binding NarL/FixJ family response regulator